jgi:hypothetical protein
MAAPEIAVQRQYTGTAGRIENAQVAVYLTYTARSGHAMIDRELYLPKSWAEDQGRRAEAGIPAEITFATKPALAAAMITRAVQAGVPARWVTGDEVYGADPDLRAQIEGLGLGYVLAIGCNRRVVTHGGALRVDDIAAALPEHCWQRRSAGAGAKGPRLYDWAWIALTDRDGPGQRGLGLAFQTAPDHAVDDLLLTAGADEEDRIWVSVAARRTPNFVRSHQKTRELVARLVAEVEAEDDTRRRVVVAVAAWKDQYGDVNSVARRCSSSALKHGRARAADDRRLVAAQLRRVDRAAGQPPHARSWVGGPRLQVLS